MKAKWINFDVVATCLMYHSYRLHDTGTAGVTGATEAENDLIKPGWRSAQVKTDGYNNNLVL